MTSGTTADGPTPADPPLPAQTGPTEATGYEAPTGYAGPTGYEAPPAYPAEQPVAAVTEAAPAAPAAGVAAVPAQGQPASVESTPTAWPPPYQPYPPPYPQYPVQPGYPAQYPVQPGYPAQYPVQPGYPAQYPVQPGYPAGYAGYPVPVYPPSWTIVAAPPAKARQRWWQWVINVFAAMIILASGGAVVAFQDVVGGTSARWVQGGPTIKPLPDALDSVEVWSAWAKEAIRDTVAAQANALLAGDESGYLAAVDPENADLVRDLTDRYRTVHAMGPGVWKTSLIPDLHEEGNRRWSVTLGTVYCFGPPTCKVVSLLAPSEWTLKGERVVLTKLDQTKTNGPRPWETEALVIKNGSRVVLGAPRTISGRLAGAVGAADRAAKVADQFSAWEDAPSKYLIFFAGPTEWSTWYGDEQPEWAAAVTIPVSNIVSEVVIRDRAVRQSDLEFLLTHELTHVTSLAGRKEGADYHAWWLVEGIADYAAMLKYKISSYDALSVTRSYVRNKWSGDPAVDPPTASASDEDAAARYGVAFLAVRGIAQKYGQAKMIDFFGKVVHDDESLEDAAKASLGAPWATVKKECTAFVRSSVGA